MSLYQTLKQQVRFVFVGVAMAVWMVPATALNLPAGITEVTSVQGVTEYQLQSNGLRILLIPEESRPSVSVNMTYLVGARHENYGQTGMAHLLEHMIFKGTPTIRNAMAEFSKRGLQFNGTTSSDRTNYFATFTADPAVLDWYLAWQADAMINALILREDLDSEMTVVRNEMESGENNPFQVLLQKMGAAAYQWHSYGKSVIGARSDVEGVDIEQLRDFYRTYYQPDNAVLTVAGKFDPQQVLEVIAREFGPIPKPARTLPREYTLEPIQDGERRVTLRRIGGTPLVAAQYHIPPGAHEDFAAMDLAAMMMSDSPSGRLYKAMVPTGLASAVFGSARDMHDPGVVLFAAQLQDNTDPELALRTLTQTLETIRDEPFTEEELNRAKSQWLNGWDDLYNNVQRLGISMSGPIARGDWRLFFLQRDRIKAASLKEVQRVANDYLLIANRTEGLYVPTDKPVRAPNSQRPNLQALLNGYVGELNAQAAEAFDPSPQNIDRLTQRKILNLPSGPVQLALLPKDTRGKRVRVEIEVRFANAELLRGKGTVSSVATSLLSLGSTQLSRQQINDRLDELNAEMSIGGRGTGVTISLSTIEQNMPALLELALHVLKSPEFAQDQLTEYKSNAITGLRSSMTDPRAIASRALARYDNPWPEDDLRYTPTFEQAIAQIEAVSREDLIAFHKQFYGAGNISVAAAGSFDPDLVVKILSEALGQWQRAPAYQRVDDPYRPIKPDNLIIETPDKANAVFVARLPLELQDTDKDYPALVVANYLVGGSPESRLWTRIRETDGLSYHVGSRLSASAYEPSGAWTLSGIFAPENLGRFETALKEELERANQEGFTDQEVSNAIGAILTTRALRRSQDAALASTWIDYLATGRTFAWSAEMDEKLSKLDAQTVNEALRRHLGSQAMVRVVAGDFANATGATKKTP